MKRNLFLSLLLVLSVVPLSSCKKYHTVYFHPHRGCEAYFIEVLHNSTIPLFKEIDFYDDDTFLGWYYGDTYWDFDEYKVTKDMDLSARWTTDNSINTSEATIIKFWMYGNDIELAFYKNIVEEFNTLYKGKINAHSLHRDGKEIVRTAVDGRAGNDVVAAGCEVENGKEAGCLSR